MTVEDDFDELYAVAPTDFLARRKELVAAAKMRGDADAARLLGLARRPTTAAWVVNLLVRRDPTARPRLNELTEALTAAHSAMDGPRIRELTALQRKVIDALARAGLAAADHVDPPAALRNDVTDTLQAAVADPDVAARLGRLEKAERWSGFGEFGTTTAMGPVPKVKPKPGPKQEPEVEPPEADVAAARARVDAARADADSTRENSAAAAELLSDRQARLATERRRYEKLLETLSAAEYEVASADDAAAAAERSAREAADRWDAAQTALDLAESELARLTTNPPVP